MENEPSATYFEHYARCNDLSVAGRQYLWHNYNALFRTLLPKDRGARILDFGCGAGLLIEWLNSLGFTDAEGVDSDPGQIRFAESLQVNANLASDSLQWLSGSGKFDLIFLNEVLEHVPRGDDVHLLSRLYESLNPGGLLVIMVPNANASFAARIRYIDSTHHRSYTEISLHHDLECAGFRNVLIRASNVSPRNFKDAVVMGIRSCFRAFRRLEAMSEWGIAKARFPLSTLLVAEARK